jgi:hypothetical protein
MLRPHLAAGEGFAPSPPGFRDRWTTVIPPRKSGAIARNCIGIFALRVRGPAWLNDDGKMVRQAGNAPASPVWKTGILLLNDWRMAAAPRVALSSPPLQGGAFLHTLRSDSKVARATSAALALCSARQAGVDAVRPNAHGGPPRYCPAFYRLRGDCITINACRPKVLQSGFAPASRSYQDRA